ncbi:MAG TPA: general secretion pathway protein GspB [Geobacterales bacterium]|nr:general secretion pathway protein GspB [Geobacterales bacterium]
MMSSILKALKRLEDEKHQRRDSAPDLNRAILSDKRGRRLPLWQILASLALVSLIASSLTYIFTKQGALPAPQPQAVPMVSTDLVTPPPAVLREKIDDPVTPFPEPSEAISRKAPPRHEPVVAEPPITPPKPAPPSSPQPTVTSVQPESHGLEPPLVRPVVTGIAAQQEQRFAVVNGRTVQEGGVVEGFVVEQILNDRVIFRHDGEAVTVPLSDR